MLNHLNIYIISGGDHTLLAATCREGTDSHHSHSLRINGRHLTPYKSLRGAMIELKI